MNKRISVIACIIVIIATNIITMTASRQQPTNTHEIVKFNHKNGIQAFLPRPKVFVIESTGSTETIQNELYGTPVYTGFACDSNCAHEEKESTETAIPIPSQAEQRTQAIYEQLTFIQTLTNMLDNALSELNIVSGTLNELEEQTSQAYSNARAVHDEMYTRIISTEWVSLGYFTITHYCLCIRCAEQWSYQYPGNQNEWFVQSTASGTIPQAGRTIATDTSVIPFGTEVLINGHIYVAEDRGGAITGNRIDILVHDHQYARQRGKLLNVPVYKERTVGNEINEQDETSSEANNDDNTYNSNCDSSNGNMYTYISYHTDIYKHNGLSATN